MAILYKVFVLQLISVVVSSDPDVFLQEPGSGPVHLAPLETQVELSCSVKEGYKIPGWKIVLPGDNDAQLLTEVVNLATALSKVGIVVTQTSPSGRDSLLVINGTERNNQTSVICVAADMNDVLLRFDSRVITVTLYGAPPIPVIADPSALSSEAGSLNITWSSNFIEGVAVYFTLIATNLNTSSTTEPVVVTGIEDQYYIFTAMDSTSCDVYNFQVTAVNDAGSSNPSEIISTSLPSLPDVSPVEESLHYRLVKAADSVVMHVTFHAAAFCPQYPVINYTLIYYDNPELGTERIPTDTSGLSVTLAGDSHYDLHIEVTNEIGSVKTNTRKILTSDVQDVTLSILANSSYSIMCAYLSGSDARGCVYTLMSEVEGVENVTGTVGRGNSTELVLDNIGCYSEVVAFDWESDDSIGTVPIRRSINNTNETCSFPADQGEPFMIVIIVVAVVVLGILFIVLDLVIAVVLYKRGSCAKRRAKLRIDQRNATGYGVENAVAMEQNGAVALNGNKLLNFTDYDVLRDTSRPSTVQGNMRMQEAGDLEVEEEHLYSTLTASVVADRKVTPPQNTTEDIVTELHEGHVYQVLERPDLLPRSDFIDSSQKLGSDVPPHIPAYMPESPTDQAYHTIPASFPPQPHDQMPPPSLPLRPPSLQTPGHCVYAEIGGPVNEG